MQTPDRDQPAPRVTVVTGADSNQMPLLRMMLASLRALPGSGTLPVACFDLGLTDEERRWLGANGVELITPRHRFDVPGGPWPGWLGAYLAQPFLRETLPGWDVYLWIDADIWFQDNRALQAFVGGAMERGLAIAHERTPMYRWQPRLTAWTGKHFLLGFGALEGAWLLSRPHLNSGLYAMHAKAPHWDAWIAGYQAAITRSGSPTPHGQFAINQLVYGRPFGDGGLPTAILEPWCNWICDRGPPMWNDETGLFCEPSAPHRTISALHLAGPGKRSAYSVRRTGGGTFTSRILPGASPERAVGAPA
jgi:hypothetical protein